MSTALKLRRGTTAQHATFTGAAGEITLDTDKNTVVVHDGTTAGGHPLSRAGALGTMSTQNADSVNIDGGAIDNTAIGANTASTGAFTTLSASSTVSGTGFSTYLASPPAIGGTVAAAGAFTTLSASDATTLSAGTASAPALTTSGDTNTGVFFPAADTVAVTTGGTERVRVDSSGNVGIGTSSPGQKLSVAGTIESTTGGVKYPDGNTQAVAWQKKIVYLGTLDGASGGTSLTLSVDFTPFNLVLITFRDIYGTDATHTLSLNGAVFGSTTSANTDRHNGFLIVDRNSGIMTSCFTVRSTNTVYTGFPSSLDSSATIDFAATGGSFSSGTFRFYGM
jgi:hypothetical protein